MEALPGVEADCLLLGVTAVSMDLGDLDTVLVIDFRFEVVLGYNEFKFFTGSVLRTVPPRPEFSSVFDTEMASEGLRKPEENRTANFRVIDEGSLGLRPDAPRTEVISVVISGKVVTVTIEEDVQFSEARVKVTIASDSHPAAEEIMVLFLEDVIGVEVERRSSFAASIPLAVEGVGLERPIFLSGLGIPLLSLSQSFSIRRLFLSLSTSRFGPPANSTAVLSPVYFESFSLSLAPTG